MKILLKLIIVIGLALTMGRYVLTQTTPGQSYYTEHLKSDLNTIRSKLIIRLGGSLNTTQDANLLLETSILLDDKRSIGYPQYSAEGGIVVTPQTLEKRLQYYKDNKEMIWEKN